MQCWPLEWYWIKPSLYMTTMGINQWWFRCPKCDCFNTWGVDETNTYIEGNRIFKGTVEITKQFTSQPQA